MRTTPDRNLLVRLAGTLIILTSLVARPAGAQQSAPALPATASDSIVSLDAALREARARNAHLPVAALDVDIARTAVSEGRASRTPRVGLASGLNVGAPSSYTTSQGALQLVALDTLYSGGLRRANLRASQFRVEGARAGFRMAEKEVEFSVRIWFAELSSAQRILEFRREGIARLRSYLTQIRLRKAAGQPVGGDVLTAQVRLGAEEALLADAGSRLDEARLQLNDLMGREPAAPLVAAPLPAPAGAPAPLEDSWRAVPDVQQAAANSAVAAAAIAATQAERRPQVSLNADAGLLPVFGRDFGTGPNGGSGFGGTVFLSMSMPLLDGGVYRARLERAELETQQMRDSQVVVERQVRLAYQSASAQLARLSTQVAVWARNAPIARDAYLQMASMYNGGAATTLEVLDAYAGWINASQSYADAVLRYRQAEANYLRWGTP